VKNSLRLAGGNGSINKKSGMIAFHQGGVTELTSVFRKEGGALEGYLCVSFLVGGFPG